MARVEIQGLAKRHPGGVVALDDFSLAVADGELVAVLGPSGCGKSTLLRLVAGLDTPTAGSIHMDGRRIDDLPPQARDVAMVFQNYALYPHMTVRENIEFPLSVRRMGAPERRRRVADGAATLEVTDLLDRRPAELSGGQRQRVALARALVREPALFLLDEPMSNLDARLRTTVRRELRALQRRLRITTLLVTHDQQDAMTLGDRVVVLAAGRVQQVGTPPEVYDRPANVFVAGFLGNPPMNLLDAVVGPSGQLEVEGLRLPAAPTLATRMPAPGTPVRLGIRAEAFAAAPAGAEGLVAELDPTTLERLGAESLVVGRVGTRAVVVRLDAGTPVPTRVTAPLDALHLFAVDDGRRLAPSR